MDGPRLVEDVVSRRATLLATLVIAIAIPGACTSAAGGPTLSPVASSAPPTPGTQVPALSLEPTLTPAPTEALTSVPPSEPVTPGPSLDPFADQWWVDGAGSKSRIEPLGPNAPPAAVTREQALRLADKYMDFEGEPDVVLRGRIDYPPGEHRNVWLIVERYAHGERRWVSGPPCEQAAPSASPPPCEPMQHWYRMTVAGSEFDDQTGDDIFGFDQLVPEPTEATPSLEVSPVASEIAMVVADFGIYLTPIPDDAPASKVTEEEAVRLGATYLNLDGEEPLYTAHGIGPVNDTVVASVWLVIFKVPPMAPFPVGPACESAPPTECQRWAVNEYAGAMISDQSGKPLRSFTKLREVDANGSPVP